MPFRQKSSAILIGGHRAVDQLEEITLRKAALPRHLPQECAPEVLVGAVRDFREDRGAPPALNQVEEDVMPPIVALEALRLER